MDIDSCIYVVDDDNYLRERMRLVIENAGFRCQVFEDAEQFLSEFQKASPACLLLDVNLPGLDGEHLQAELLRLKIHIPIIFISAFGTIPMVVRTLKAGAVDFLPKPVSDTVLLERIEYALKQDEHRKVELRKDFTIQKKLESLTPREFEIMQLAIAGHQTKVIAHQFGISYRTVEKHRRVILKKIGVKNFLEVAMLYELRQSKLHQSAPKGRPG